MLFPYTHVLFAQEVLGKLNEEITLGALYPDIAVAGFTDHREAHWNNAKLFGYLSALNQFTDFGKAAITHGSGPRGLDYYCDEKYKIFEKGYAFEMAKPIVSKVVDACNLPEKMGLWKSHNFIEMATELWVYNQAPKDYGIIAQALTDQALVLELSNVLAPYYNLPPAKIAMSCAFYGEYVIMNEVTPFNLAKRYGKQTQAKHGITINLEKSAKIIEEAFFMIEPNIREFLDYSKEKVKNELEIG